MQRKRPPPAQRQIWTILLILALLVLFVLAAGTSCTANPYLYGGRGWWCSCPLPQRPAASWRRFRAIQDCEVSLLCPESKLF